MSKCPECKEPLSNPTSCACGWVSKNYQPVIKQCFHCHTDINGKYYRGFKSVQNGITTIRYKCADCLLYADLDWRDKHYIDWLEIHPEFKFKPVTDQDQKDLQEMSMAYVRKITKGGGTRRLPYDKNKRVSENYFDEQSLLDQLPKAPVRFDDLETPL